MTEPVPVYEEVTEISFSALEPGESERHHLMVYVRHRSGHGADARYAVMRWDREALGLDGEFDWEPSPSNREDDWIETHRFDLETAKRLAREIAPKLTVNGWTVDDVRRIHRGEKVERRPRAARTETDHG